MQPPSPTTAGDQEHRVPAEARLHPYAWAPVTLIAGTLGAVLLALAGRYGYHRDELYYLAAGRHLAWGYDDQPPLAPVLARLMDAIAPGSLLALRTPSALLAVASVLLVAALARELGADRRGQVVAAIATAVAPIVVFTGHLLSTTTVEFTLAAGFAVLLARWIRTRRDRLLLFAGVVAGVALLNKATFGFLLAAFALAALLVGPRQVFSRPALWAGAVIAAVAWAPYLWWQASHGWPQLEMADAIRADEPGGGRILMLPMQVALLGPPIVAVAVGGLWWLLRNPQARPYRALGLGSLLLLGFFLVLGGQMYYPASGHPALIAAGGVATAGWLARGNARLRTAVWRIAAGLTAVTTVGLGLPVYPVSALAGTPQPAVFPDGAETVGWPELVAAVADAYTGLPEPDRSRAVVFTSNYGEAGAIERYGPEHGLPAPYSGHNGYWHWGPPPDTATGPVVLVGRLDEDVLRSRWCGSLTLVTRFDNGVDLDNEEQGVPIRICREPTTSWSHLWPQLRHLD